MNALIVGSQKETVLQYLPDTFLLIDDGPIIDQIELPARKSVTVFDPARHSFNPLKDMDYLKARELIAVLDAVFPEGENTLTRKNSNFILLNALLGKRRSLEHLLVPKSDATHTDAYQKIQTLLLSPVLKNVLTRPTNMSFKGIILAKLDRAVLGDFDCFVLANLLISQYRGPVVIPDFGFYQCGFHTSLLRQNRLIAGINSFDETLRLKQQLLLIHEKRGSRCTPADAKLLAIYAGLLPGTNAYNDFISRTIGAY